jgi:dihydropteroate synthase
VPGSISTGVAPPAPTLEEVRRAARFRARVLDPSGAGRDLDAPIHLGQVSLAGSILLKENLLAFGAITRPGEGTGGAGSPEALVSLTTTLGEIHAATTELDRRSPEIAELEVATAEAIHRYRTVRGGTLRGLHRAIPLGPGTRVMGVLNVTPDSFSDGGAHLDPARAVARAQAIAEEGADLLDIGAESTRPGAEDVSPEVEWQRLEPVLRALPDLTSVPISVDTRHAEVARRALEAGADLVNDVSGLRDPEMRRLLARTGAPAIAMHMRGTPGTMQRDLEYVDVVAEVYGGLAEAVAAAIADGADPDCLLVDPGLGFGKSGEQNLTLLHRLREFRCLGFPIVVGASRKSFLGRSIGGTEPADRLEPGLAAATIATLAGASYVRTHDVRATVRAVALANAVREERFSASHAE